MILKRLYELALRENLLADPAFEALSVPFIIELDEEGRPRGEGINEREKPIDVPRPHGNTASQGFARFLVDTIPRIVPMSYDLSKESEDKRAAELAKRGRSRTTFWNQIDRAADETDDAALRAVQAFGRRLRDDSEVVAALEKALEARKAKATDRCTFAYAPDMGTTIVEREAVKHWYREFYRQYTGGKQESGPTGLCQVTGQVGPIPTTHPIKVSVPGGMSVGVALVSYDKAAFESYGMVGTSNASIGYEAADGYGVALRALIQDGLPRGQRTSLRVGESLFLFWTREPEPTDFLEALNAPQTEAVEKLINAPAAGDVGQTSSDVNDFYCLVLSGNAARAVVRDYLEERLPRVRESVGSWFRDLKIAGIGRDDYGHPIATFPLWVLASSMTVRRAGKQPDWQRVNQLVPRLMSAALRNEALPDGILASYLQRIRAEGSAGFRPARMALIKLCLIRKGVPVTEKLNPMESHPAYVCGELLYVFDQIQRAAMPEVNATVVDRFYGSFSAAPMTVLGELFRKAEHHLSKLRSENKKRAAALEKRLALTSHKLRGNIPDAQLTLTDQARFALGYYHAKAERIERWAEAQQRRAEGSARRHAGSAPTATADKAS